MNVSNKRERVSESEVKSPAVKAKRIFAAFPVSKCTLTVFNVAIPEHEQLLFFYKT